MLVCGTHAIGYWTNSHRQETSSGRCRITCNMAFYQYMESEIWYQWLSHCGIHMYSTLKIKLMCIGHPPIGKTALLRKVTSKTLSKPQRGGHTVVHIIPAGGGTTERRWGGGTERPCSDTNAYTSESQRRWYVHPNRNTHWNCSYTQIYDVKEYIEQ